LLLAIVIAVINLIVTGIFAVVQIVVFIVQFAVVQPIVVVIVEFAVIQSIVVEFIVATIFGLLLVLARFISFRPSHGRLVGGVGMLSRCWDTR